MGVKTTLLMTLRARLFVVSLVLLSVWVPAPASTSASASDASRAVDADLHPDIDVDDVLLRVDLNDNGSANWRVEYRVRLDDQNTTDAFEQLQADVEANESVYRERFATRMRDTVATAENATGRGMTARQFTVATERRQLPQEYGVIVYTFQWTGFANATVGRIEAGDALFGMFLDSETTLLLGWPSGYESTSVSPTPTETRERAIVWTGPLDFASGEPSIVLSSADGTTELTSTTVDGTETTAAGPGAGNSGLPTTFIAGAILLLLALGGAVFVTRGRGRTSVLEAAAGKAASTDETAATEKTAGTNGASSAERGAPSDLMSNEERVLDLLANRDGRVKQQTVVEELDWTEAKASRVVNRLKEDGRVEVFRLGRENVVSLPDEDNT